MNHQQCQQGTPTEVVVLVLCLSTKVIYIYVYAQCVCKVMCISDVCTFFDCQVPIFFIARCQYQNQRREEIANGTWGGETDQFEVEKEMRMLLSLPWRHNLDFCVLFQWVPAMSSLFDINPSSFLLSVISNKLLIKFFNVFNLTALSPHEYQPLFSYKWTWTLDSAKLPTRS